MRLISRSVWRKLAVLLMAVVALVLLSEARVLDSRFTAWQALLDQHPGPEPGETLQFVATAYCKGTTTASGVRVRTGIAAGDPTLLPVGSVITLSTGDTRYDGVYTVMDTGPKVQGRTLDLYIWSCHEALAFGRRPVSVTVLRLGWDPSASSPSIVERLFQGREAARRTRLATPAPPAAATSPIDSAISAASSEDGIAAPVDVEAPAAPHGGEDADTEFVTAAEPPEGRSPLAD
jgi:3D (Asp-Asp-Asp) domain-containing protein